MLDIMDMIEGLRAARLSVQRALVANDATDDALRAAKKDLNAAKLALAEAIEEASA